MATLKLAIVPAKVSKSGTHKIRVAIGHRQQTHYLVTRFSIDDLSQFKAGQVVNRADANVINKKLRTILNDYQDKLDKIEPSRYTASQLREYLSSVSLDEDNSFTTYANSFIKELKEDKRHGYSGFIQRAVDLFAEYNNGDVLLSSITPQLIRNYERFLNNSRELSPTTIGMMMCHLRTVINRAQKDRVVKYEINPFEYYVPPAKVVRELDITKEELILIRDAQLTDKSVGIARDLFMLSYYLGGINLIDLLGINFQSLEQISYVREKSKNTKRSDKTISITIPEEAKPIILKYRNKKGKIDLGYKFTYHNLSCYIAGRIRKLTKDLQIDKRVVFYSARKSFVQHGFELGVTLEILEYCIGQSMKANRPIFNYVKIMRKHADEAIRKILDNLKQ
ncbi:MAG: site-specific integrase [Bacteroides sp.]|uniref:tyrosine-type recombinase/integrase n=1 Tax=Bacteroides sp. TaxID=29523 RepID=UPI002FCC79FC